MAPSASPPAEAALARGAAGARGPLSSEIAAELGARWQRARRAALASLLEGGELDDERALLARALAVDAAEAARRVFDNSLRLGKSFARYYERELTLGELPALLSALGLPCLHGSWQPCADEPGYSLERAGCAQAGACDHYREAIDGLVLGLTGGIRHTRHESQGHGGAACVDVLYLDPESPLRFGALPDELHDGLEAVRALTRRFDSSVELVPLGVSEGVLLYRLERSGCAGELDVGALVERSLRKRFPQLALRELSPRPVLDPTG